MDEFIQIYPNALSADVCQQLIRKFEKSGKARAGQTGQGVDVAKKNSLDLMLNEHPEWQPELIALTHTTLQCLVSYVRKFPSFLAGALSPTVMHPVTGVPVQLTAENVSEFEDDIIINVIRAIFRLGTVNLQKYPKGRGGYHHWHSEIFPHPSDPQQNSLHRTLVFMVYLNDVDAGGETEFFYQQCQLKPTRGSLVLFPAGFTHTHKGAVPISGDKYILTSWVLYQSAEKLYGK